MHRPAASAVVLAAVTLVGAACSVSTARPAAMMPDQIELLHHHQASVMIDTTGTEGNEILEFHLVTPVRINANDLSTTLERTVTETKLFGSVVRGSQADYHLEVEAKVTAPGGGFNVTCRVGGTWKLTRQKSGAVVFDEFVTAEATKSIRDAFDATERIRLAVEAAAQAFIRDGLQRIGRLQLE
jgi:hypothetical protein